MTVKDLLTVEDVSNDVYDSYDERCAIAYESGFKLTDAGYEYFAEALKLPIESISGHAIVVRCNNEDEADWCQALFYAIAGYCSDSKFDEWFEER